MPQTNDTSAASSAPNGRSTIGEAIYALTDEQILDIDDATVPEGVVPSEQSESRNLSVPASSVAENQQRDSSAPPAENAASARNDSQTSPTRDSQITSRESPVTSHESPPEWLAQAMSDPQRGGPARQFWESAQQGRAQAAQLAVLDRAYFGAPDTPPAELAASREVLAQQLLRENPAAFREMLAAGLRALGVKDVVTPGEPSGTVTEQGNRGHESRISSRESLVSQYAAFERAANEDLDHAVRPEIARVLERALPAGNNESARATQERLSALVHTEIETALRQDRALGEQVAQLLGARTFDDATRAQVVRLIAARATSLVPAASRRILAAWTQSALAAHRAKVGQAGRPAQEDVRPDGSGAHSATTSSSRSAAPNPGQVPTPVLSKRRIDYRALSDEEILDL